MFNFLKKKKKYQVRYKPLKTFKTELEENKIFDNFEDADQFRFALKFYYKNLYFVSAVEEVK